LKFSKLISNVLIAGTMLAVIVPASNAGSIGRSGGGSSSSSSSASRSSSSSSSFSRPSSSYSSPSAAPSRPGGIGGTSGSMGVRKSEVTAPVAAKVEQKRVAQNPTPTAGATQSTQQHSGYQSTPTYQSAPAPVVVQQSSGGFGSTFAGAMAGSMLGNAMFGNHGNNGGTTIVNNGGTGGVVPQQGGAAISTTVDQSGNPVVVQQVERKSYGIWEFTKDVIAFAFLVAILVGIAYIFYKGLKMIRNFIKRENGTTNMTQPFSPTSQFWEIQKAFSVADVDKLKTLLGPDLVDELTMDAQPSELALHNVSHEVVLNNPNEFSVHYVFEDSGEEVNQVWHYELHGGSWKLNGIENI